MASPVTAPSITTWQLDPTHSSVEFAIRHLMISTVKGRFSDLSATISGDESDIASQKVTATIQVASINTHQADRDTHLRSADFFDLEHHPTMTFVGRRAEGDLRGDFRLTGDLTIRGTTREITLNVTAEGRTKDPWGGERTAFSATGKISRSDFGLTWNQALETGGVVVGDEVKISIEAQFVRQAPAA
ncbi:MAG TPA: YceI family protein [Gemmatimonadaceae bacterium]|jgi:polyisoprenoid-binding protein YceI|nr:YceI family protein [Gemmatimonadaceae bacterium]